MKTVKNKEGKKMNRLITKLIAAMLVCGTLVSSTLASTCIITPASGNPDPCSSLASSIKSIDAVGGVKGVLSETSLEARFWTFYASLGIRLTTGPLGFMLSVQ